MERWCEGEKRGAGREMEREERRGREEESRGVKRERMIKRGRAERGRDGGGREDW